MGLRISRGAPIPAEASPTRAEGEEAESAALIDGDRLGLCQVPGQPDQVGAGSLPQLPKGAYSTQLLSPGIFHLKVKVAKSVLPSGCFACGRQGPLWTRRPSRPDRPARHKFPATKWGHSTLRPTGFSTRHHGGTSLCDATVVAAIASRVILLLALPQHSCCSRGSSLTYHMFGS